MGFLPVLGGGDGCLFVERADGCGDNLRELPVLFWWVEDFGVGEYVLVDGDADWVQAGAIDDSYSPVGMINDCFRVVSESVPNLGDGVGIGVDLPEMLTRPVFPGG